MTRRIGGAVMRRITVPRVRASSLRSQGHLMTIATEQTDWNTAQFEAVFQAFPDLFFRLDAEGTILDYKAGNVSSLYVPPEVFMGKRMQDVLPSEVGEKFARAIQQVIQTSDVVSIDYSLPMPEGEGYYDARLVRLPESQIGVVVRDITERKHTEERSQHQFRRLAALRAIDAAITSSFDLNLTLSVMLNQVTDQLSVDAACVLLLDPHTQVLEYAAGRGFRAATFQHTRLRLGEGYAGLAALERRTIHVANLRGRKTDFLRSPTFAREGFIMYYGVPLIAKGQVKGVLEIFHRAPLKADAGWLDFLKTLAGQAAIAIDSATLFKDLQRSNVELTMAYDATIEGWSRALELRDRETEGHTQRVTEMTLQLARHLGVSEAELVHIRRGALLHDIGKLGIPDNILSKPGSLTDEEKEIIRQHPQHAYDLLTPIAYLRPALDIPYSHHEKWDGGGYPRGLKDKQIPLAARIFAVVDVYDALTSDRPYRPAWTREKALEYIRAEAGIYFDPQAARAFINIINR